MPSGVEERDGVYNDDGDVPSETKSAMEIKQQLLGDLATEAVVQRLLYGMIALVPSDMQWFGVGLPHSTVFAPLKLFGFEDARITFFRKFAEAPLRFGEAANAEMRVRKRDLPMAHTTERVLGEAVLFALDIAVNQESRLALYRLHDDMWLCGDPEKCASAWSALARFAKLLGLEINHNKTDSVCLTASGTSLGNEATTVLPKCGVTFGLLKLDVSGQWIIDQTLVDAHVIQLQKQLGACTSNISWVQVWNNCIGRFFMQPFGDPAECFGRGHVDSILWTHGEMQSKLFTNRDERSKSVTDHLKELIERRLAVSEIPHSFLFLPE